MVFDPIKENLLNRRLLFTSEERRELNAGLRWKSPKRSSYKPSVIRSSKYCFGPKAVKFKSYARYGGDVSSYVNYLDSYHASISERMDIAKKNILKCVLFESRVIRLFIGNLIHAGGRQKAISIFRAFLFSLAKSEFYLNSGYRSPLHVLFAAVQMISPRVVLCSKRVGGVVYRLPIFIARDRRSYSFGVRWIVQAARKRSGASMPLRLVSEICDLFEKKGLAYKRKVELYNIALSNKPFLHYLRRRKRRGRLLARLNRK